MNEIDNSFEQITAIIENARNNAYRKVNEELILMYQRTAILDREEFRCPQNTSNRDTIIWTQFRAGSGFQPLFGLPNVVLNIKV